MKTRNLITAGIIGAGLTFGVVAQAAHEETQVELKDVPEAAQTTIKEKAGNDQILRIEKETRKGKECYEAIVNKDGKETAIRRCRQQTFADQHSATGRNFPPIKSCQSGIGG